MHPERCDPIHLLTRVDCIEKALLLLYC